MLSTLPTLALAVSALAAPGSSPLSERQTVDVCTSGYSAQCCATDVLNLASLDCRNVPETPTSKEDFTAQCSTEGQQALCCLLPILEQGLICQEP